MTIRKVFNVTYFRKDGTGVDYTQVDENDEQLIWDLFVEFGHKRVKGDYYEVEEREANEDE